MLVLKIGTAYMGERCHAQTDHIRSSPQQAAVEKTGLFRIFHSGVRAGDGVPGLSNSR